ncbi:MAG TPA: hypothetical protein VKG61_22780 [Streptosporangiaceae bacterium]|nr:hypothetical protein [Streptosporangiaceae bacterium]HME67731.1 hypothetical protein [Streptosporangiaceae bacterium]
MNKYRSAALVLATCAAGLSVAACSAGTPSASSAGPSTASPAASSHSTPPVVSSAVPTTGPPIAGSTVKIKGNLGSFPVPAAAKVGENMSSASSLLVVFGLVAPADVARFYATALPQAGFTVTSNSLVSQGGQSGAIVAFTGHGYKGNIESVAQFPGASIAGLGTANVTTIVMSAAK